MRLVQGKHKYEFVKENEVNIFTDFKRFNETHFWSESRQFWLTKCTISGFQNAEFFNQDFLFFDEVRYHYYENYIIVQGWFMTVGEPPLSPLIPAWNPMIPVRSIIRCGRKSAQLQGKTFYLYMSPEWCDKICLLDILFMYPHTHFNVISSWMVFPNNHENNENS